MKKLNVFQIKIILIILMLLDHLFFAFPQIFPTWVHGLTRGVAPMFAYFMVEGYFYTRNKIKYGFRLFVWSVFMQIGNIIINSIFSSKGIFIHNNIFSTLFIGYMTICIFEYAKREDGFKKIASTILGIMVTLIGAMVTEGGSSVIPFTLITYFFRGNLKKQIIGYISIAILLFLMSFNIYETFNETFEMLMFNSDFLLILAIPTILMYDGERGMNNNFSKYLFYIFYPLHLWLIALVTFMIR